MVICLYIMTRGDQRKSTFTQLPWYLRCSSLPSTAAHVLYPVSCKHSLCLWRTTVRYSIKEHVPVANYITRENILLGITWFHLYPANHIYLSCTKSGLKKGLLWTGTDSTNDQQCGNLLIYLLTAIGLTPSGSIRVHIYTQTIHRTTQLTTLVGGLSEIRTQSAQNKNDEPTA